MTREDIIKMARAAGVLSGYEADLFQRFAALVAAHEREAIWNILFDCAGRDDLSDSDESLLKHLSDLIRARGKPLVTPRGSLGEEV